MNTMFIIGILAVVFGLPLVLLAHTIWVLYRNGKKYNKEHGLP